MALAAAAVLLIVLGGLLWVRSHPPVQTATVTIDLRERSVARGDPSGSGQAPVELSRGAKHLILDLPIGSKEGGYDLALLGAAGAEIRTTTGVAQLENHTVVMKANLDLAGVLPGTYFLGVRQPGLEWSRYPVHLK